MNNAQIVVFPIRFPVLPLAQCIRAETDDGFGRVLELVPLDQVGQDQYMSEDFDAGAPPVWLTPDHAASEALGGSTGLRGLLDEAKHSTLSPLSLSPSLSSSSSELLLSALESQLMSCPLSLPLLLAPCFSFQHLLCSHRRVHIR